MPSNQIVALVLSVLVIGAGAAGAVAVTGPLQSSPPPWANDDPNRDIDVSVTGNVSPGETVTLTATLGGEPVPHAPVEVAGETVGETDTNGRLDVTVPDDDEFEVEIEPDFEGELAHGFEEAEDGDDADDNDDDRRIDIAIDGNVTPDETVTITATVNGTPLANADIVVNGEDVGNSDANGTIQVSIPENADDFEVEAEFDEKGKLTVQLAGDEEDDEDREGALEVTVSGDVAPGGTVTVTVTHEDAPVENAAVSVTDVTIGTTDADGQIHLTIPVEAEEVKIEVGSDDHTGEWEAEFEAAGEEADGDDAS